MVIERLAAERDRGRDPGVNDRGRDPGVNKAAPLPDVNRMPTRPALDFGIRGSGTRITRVVKGSNAEQIGFRSGDVVLTINNQSALPGADIADVCR